MDYLRLLFIFVALWSLQGYMTFRQYKYINQTISGLTSKHHSGYLGVGRSAARFKIGRGSIAIVVVDYNDVVLDVLYMVGISFFAKFKVMDEYKGIPSDQVQVKDAKFNKAYQDALGNIELQKNK